MKIKFFEKKKKFQKGGIHINPNIYWSVCLSLAFVIILASFVFGFYLFKSINQEFKIENNDDLAKKINQEMFDNVLEYFSGREQASNKILNSPSPVVDPSL